MSDNLPNKDKKKKQPFDRSKFKKGVAFVESNDGKFLWNKTSSATGRYQFLYNDIKHLPEMKGVTREQFRDNPELQEKIMDMAIDNKIKGRPGYFKNAEDLTQEFKDSFGEKWNYRPDEVALLTHFLGRQGARSYLKSELSGKEFKVPGQNLKVSEYLDRYNKSTKRKRGIDKPTYPKNPVIQQMMNNEFETNVGIQDSTSPSQFKMPAINPLFQANVPSYQEAPLPETQRGGVKGQSNIPNVQSQAQWLEQYLGSNQFSLGGNMGKSNEEGLVTYDTGGTHEQNPNGGIPQGMASNGKMNTVEEGETSYELKNGKFVFSDRLGFF